MKPLTMSDPLSVWFAALNRHLTQITFKHGGPEELTISITWRPSADLTIPNDTRLAFEALLKNMFYPSIGNKDSLEDDLNDLNRRLLKANRFIQEAKDLITWEEEKLSEKSD